MNAFFVKRLGFGTIILVHCTHELMEWRDIFTVKLTQNCFDRNSTTHNLKKARQFMIRIRCIYWKFFVFYGIFTSLLRSM